MRPAGFPLAAAIVLAMAAPSPAEADMRIGLAAPLTGRYSSGGAETQRGAEAAVADLNAGGGVLGEQIEIITADDYCEAEQALAAANKLLAAGVVAVFGHQCSGAAIPASKVYAEAEILLISNEAFPSTPANLSPFGCRPSRIAPTMSGARQVSGRSRQT